jgi:hypothetical protein
MYRSKYKYSDLRTLAFVENAHGENANCDVVVAQSVMSAADALDQGEGWHSAKDPS